MADSEASQRPRRPPRAGAEAGGCRNGTITNENRKQHLDRATYGAGLAADPSTWCIARLSAGIRNPRGYINQPARAGSWLVPPGTYHDSDRLRPGPGLAIMMRACQCHESRPGARAYTTITVAPNTKSPAQGQSQGQPKRRPRRWRPKAVLRVSRRCLRRGQLPGVSCRCRRSAAASAASDGDLLWPRCEIQSNLIKL